jgi:hypothetical protein
MKSSLHRLISFLSLFCSRQFRRLNSIHSSAPKVISREAGVSKLDPLLLDYYSSVNFLITTLHGPRRKHSLCLVICCLATDVLLLCESAGAGMCLPSHCLAIGIHVQYHYNAIELIQAQIQGYVAEKNTTFKTADTKELMNKVNRL